MKKLRKKIQSEWLRKSLFAITFLLTAFSNLWLINVFGSLVDSVTIFNMDIFMTCLFNFVAALILTIIFTILTQYFLRALLNYTEMDLKKYTYGYYLKNTASIKNNNSAKTISRLNSDIPIISNWISIGVTDTLVQTLYLIICLCLMLYYNSVITLLTLVIICIVFLFARIFSRYEASYTKIFYALLEKISDKIYNSFLNVKTVRQLNKEVYFSRKIVKISIDDSLYILKGLGRYQALNESMLGFMTDILPFVVFFTGVLFYTKDLMSLGSALSMMLIAQKLNEPVIVLSELISDKKNAQKVYERISDLYKEKSKEKYDVKIAEKFSSLKINISNFSYTGEILLKDFQMSVKKKDLIVIKGSSGKGKTTLLRLITKLLPLNPSQGIITYNGENIQYLDSADYYKHILMAEQNTVIIEGTLEENILLGDDVSEQFLQKIIDICCLNNFYKEKGADYRITENGKNISGGERQRIALARVLLRKPEILVLDEITGSIDTHIRSELISRLIAHKQENDMTIIAVTHNNDFDDYNPKIYTL